jgi:hypothetical protein
MAVGLFLSVLKLFVLTWTWWGRLAGVSVGVCMPGLGERRGTRLWPLREPPTLMLSQFYAAQTILHCLVLSFFTESRKLTQRFWFVFERDPFRFCAGKPNTLRFSCYSSVLQGTFGIISQTMPRPLPSTSFPIHYSSIIPPFNAI